MKKRILSLMLVISVLVSLFTFLPNNVSAATEGIFTYTIENGKVTVIGCDQAVSGNLEIPSTIAGYPVTTIGDEAFGECKSLTDVTIPDNVTTIGERAFSFCRNLTNVTIPDSVTTIGEGAFCGCESLTNVTIPDSVTTIGSSAFSVCTSLTNIKVEDGNRNYCSLDGNLFNKNKTTLIQYAIGKTNASYTIPDSVTTIGPRAFDRCASLTNVTIPDSVTTIGDHAFCLCASLTNVTIPNSVITIRDYAFWECRSLTNITIPDSVTSIGDVAFALCRSLTNIKVEDGNRNYCSLDGNLFDKNKTTLIQYAIGKTNASYTIPDSVTTIGPRAFSPCASLTNVTIPDSVTTIGSYAFSACTIYYGGGESQWKNIYIDPENMFLNTAIIHYNSSGLSVPDYNIPGKKTGTFQFASKYGNKEGDNGSSIANYVYDDNYFATASKNNYNHDLSKMSLRLAMSAFAVHGSGSDKYKNQDVNAKTLLTELGFDEIESKGYTEKPSTNSIGVIAANKRIAFEDDDYTLIAVAIRGNGYESEWGGNFNVGTGEEHKGFQLARDQVLSFLTNYVRNADISGNIKIWITGFSRAAATANLTAAYLDTHSLALNGTNTDPTKIVEIKPENLYAYCFETPAGTRASDKNDSKYNNIFSIVNQNDYVPMVAPEKWEYGRYGTTYYLPSARTNSDYKTLVGNMYTYFDEYAGHNYVSWRAPVIEDFDRYKVSWSLEHAYPYFGFYLKEQNSKQTMDDFFQNLIDNLATTFKSPQYYNEHLEDALVFFVTEIMGQDKADEFGEIFADEFMSRLNPFKSAFEGVDKLSQGEKLGLLRSTVKGTFKRMSINISDEAFDGLVELFSFILDNGNLETLFGNLKILLNVHFPELCLAWIDSTQPSKYLRNTRKMCLNCPVDLEVYDSNDNLVAAIRNDEVIDIEGSSIVAYVDANGQKVVYLPTDEEYRTEIIATDDGEVTYSVQEQNATTGKTRVINYNKMAVKKDDTLIGAVENLNETEVAIYPLTSNSIKVGEPEVIENATPVTITTLAEGNGNVSGGGSLLKGEYAQFTATPFENEEFLGWYNGKTLISSEATYRFQVTEAIALTAKFTENTCEIIFLDDEENFIASERIVKGSTVTIPDTFAKDEFQIDSWFTDKELTTAYDFNTKVTKSLTLYTKRIDMEKEPEDNPETMEWKNPFSDVKADDWFYANVQYVVENKLMNGVAVDKFAPNDTLTRAMLVTVLYRNAGEPTVNKSIPFADVDMSAYYANAVVWAKQNGIVNGVSETDFAPDSNITREQIAAIMFRYAQYKGMDAVILEENLHFTDANEISEYAVSAVNWAVGAGLMNGKSATTINPKDNATRAEIAAILQRFIENNK